MFQNNFLCIICKHSFIKLINNFFSLRTLCRALIILTTNNYNDYKRSLAIAFGISFSSNLNKQEKEKLALCIQENFLFNNKQKAVLPSNSKKEDFM